MKKFFEFHAKEVRGFLSEARAHGFWESKDVWARARVCLVMLEFDSPAPELVDSRESGEFWEMSGWINELRYLRDINK